MEDFESVPIDQRIANILCSVKRNTIEREYVLESQDIPNDIGLDSLETIEFLLQLEQEFGIRIQFDSFTLDHILTVSSIASYVQTQQTFAKTT